MSTLFCKKGEKIILSNYYRNPFRDKQEDCHMAICANCKSELYMKEDIQYDDGLAMCHDCAKTKENDEEIHMTLLELSVQYRTQSAVLKTRIKELEMACEQAIDHKERIKLNQRIYELSEMWREARDIAVITERYYERGYRKNGRYTL